MVRMKCDRIWRWLKMLVVSFVMYETLWTIIEIQFGDAYIDVAEIACDLAQCALFTSVVFIVNWCYAKYRGGRFAKGFLEIVTILAVNALVIFLTDHLINERDADDVNFWGVIDIYVICVISSLISIIDIQHSYNKRIVAMEQEQKQLRMRLLQQQLSPHFVFNSLSLLRGMIATAPQTADAYVCALSHVFRYITDNIGKEKVPLADALAFINNYNKMLSARFPGHFVFDVDEKNMPTRACLVPVSLQIAVENAIKHNNHSCRQPLQISITSGGDTIVVSNKKQPLTFDERPGVGLDNLDQRYKLLIGRGLDVSETPDYYTVKIPLIYESTDSRR